MRPMMFEAGCVAAAEVTTLKTDVVGPGQLFQCHSIMARDKTSAIATYIEIGILSGTRLIPIDCTAGSFAAMVSHTLYWPFALGPGQGMYAIFATPTAGDILELVANGMIGPVANVHGERPREKHSLDH